MPEKTNFPLLKVKDLKVYFYQGKGAKAQNTIKAVNGVSFELRQGEILGLVGESGCGKSTLSRTIMRLQEAKSGEISLNGENLLSLSGKKLRKKRHLWQMVFQDPYSSLNPRINISETLKGALSRKNPALKNKEFKEKIENLLNIVGLSPQVAQKYPHEFSGGQRQRIAIARALAVEPKLIIADEPVSALDVSIQSQILNLFLDLQKKFNLSILFISHDLSVVRYISDRTAVMFGGKIVELEETEKIFSSPQHSYTKTLLAAAPQLNYTIA